MSATLTPRVLVLLATRNGAEHIDALLQSLSAQQGVDLRVDVADDDSSDGTPGILAVHANHDTRFRLLTLHEAGGSAAANFLRLFSAADLSEVDFLAFADQDDIWHADRLICGVDQLRAHQADLWSCATRAFWPDGTQRVLQQQAVMTAADYLFEGAGQGCTFLLGGGFARQLQPLLIEHAARLHGVFFHDWAVYAAARALGKRWIFDSSVHLDYRQHGSNEAGARASLSGVTKRMRLIHGGWYAQQVALIADWVAELSPADAGLRGWRKARSRLARVVWLARNGRRRRSDRMLQIFAAVTGYL